MGRMVRAQGAGEHWMRRRPYEGNAARRGNQIQHAHRLGDEWSDAPVTAVRKQPISARVAAVVSSTAVWTGAGGQTRHLGRGRPRGRNISNPSAWSAGT